MNSFENEASTRNVDVGDSAHLLCVICAEESPPQDMVAQLLSLSMIFMALTRAFLSSFHSFLSFFPSFLPL